MQHRNRIIYLSDSGKGKGTSGLSVTVCVHSRPLDIWPVIKSWMV